MQVHEVFHIKKKVLGHGHVREIEIGIGIDGERQEGRERKYVGGSKLEGEIPSCLISFSFKIQVFQEG